MIRRTPLLILFMLAACAEEAAEPAGPPPNRAPETILALPDRELAEGMAMRINFEEHFRDLDGDTLLFVARSSDPTVAAIAVEGAVLRVNARVPGQAEVSVVVRDPRELEVQDAFAVSVSASLDREVLVAFYEATDGPNWKDNTNWLTDAPLGEWYGVSVNAEGRVVGLELGGKFDFENQRTIPHGLTGSIPPELGKLSALAELDLANNQLTGAMPPELGNLSALQGLYLSSNKLTGAIPPELGQLSALERLRLSANDLSGSIPPQLGQLFTLKYLSLDRNNLTGIIPLELGNLAELQTLDLYHNSLTGPIPTELGQLFQMRTLWLAHNALTGPIPLELENLAALNYLGLQYNRLTGPIPPELGNLSGLEDVRLSVNQLTGPIPPELGNLSALRILRLGGNDLSGPIPVSFLKLSALGTLWIENTDLCVPSTNAFWEWMKERMLISPYCGNDKKTLEMLYKAMNGSEWNRADGWLGESPVLSGWHGVTTDSLGQVTGIELPANNLQGYFPGNIVELAELDVLDISDNPDIHGRLPADLTDISLETFRFAGTGLCSPEELLEWLAAIPVAEGTNETCPPLTDREILTVLYQATDGPNWRISDNWLTDAPLGEWYGVGVNEEEQVVRLVLRNNKLKGRIPAELGSLAALIHLHLADNTLAGSLPPELGSLFRLEYLDMAPMASQANCHRS